jgi:transaldolase
MLESPRMQRLMNAGARPQRLPWASTGTKDPNAPDTLYVDRLVAPLTINTLPEKTLLAVADHGKPGAAMVADDSAARAVQARFAERGLEVEDLAEALQDEGAASFVKSWNDLLDTIRQRVGKAA